MRRHLEDQPNLNSGRVFGSIALPLASVPSSNLPARTSAANAAESRVGGTGNIPVTSTSIGALPASNHSLHHPNRTANNTPLSPGPTSGSAKPPLQRQPLALIQETVHSVGSIGNTDMQSGMQFSLPSGYQSRVPAATTLSQTNHSHNQNPSPLHHSHSGQAQAHPSQVLHPGQVNSQSNVPPMTGPVQFQRLKVEDALNYLDQVKYKFGNQPQVYNDFLDIMKEFKSQSIDTPGVIQRVSTLFKGHPELIVGFNTFLPPGYRIEVQSNEQVQVSIPGTNLGPGGGSTGPTSLTINPGGTITTTTMHPVSHANQTNHLGHSNSSHPVSSNNVNKAMNHQPLTNNHPVKETPQNQHSFNQNSPANTHSSGTSPGAPSPTSTPSANQPVEFNHAINYVNKIKNRFQGQPDIYKQFLEILHTYQKEQRNLKDGVQSSTKPLTEAEVYSQVAKLFQNQEDLLQEFGQFLPDANGATNALVNFVSREAVSPAPKVTNNDHSMSLKKPAMQSKPLAPPSNTTVKPVPTIKRQAPSVSPAPSKKMKMTSLKDISLTEAGKSGSLNEFGFFDNVRRAFKSQEIYENFLRALVIYNHEIISRAELVHLIAPFLTKFPELFKWFKEFLGCKESGNVAESVPNKVHNQERERSGSDLATEIDYSSCKKYGASYRAVPRNYVQPKCSGRTALCREVLNDTWVSFPSWSEDSTFVSSKKTQYEEYIYRCEDERFELDIVLDSNLSAIHSLDAVQNKITRMSAEEKLKFRLDDTLGGNSTVHNQRAIKRLYGDKAPDVIEGLKKSPVIAVPLVLKRLKSKEEEWRKAKKGYNKVWKELNEKYYLKSLDHQGITFKPNDVKMLRSKSLINEIENIAEERHENTEDGMEVPPGPHMRISYKSKDLFQDAANLIIHHVKRQTGIHKEDKQKIKQLIRQFVPDLFCVPRGELSDDEVDKDEDMDLDDFNEDSKSPMPGNASPRVKRENEQKDRVPPVEKPAPVVSRTFSEEEEKDNRESMFSSCNSGVSTMENSISGDTYALFFVNNNWYIFFRLHHILCERLHKILERSQLLMIEELKDREERLQSTAIALRLKSKTNIDVDTYYSTFLEMVKSLLDGNVESNQYEDTLREMFGIDAYVGFTVDKIIQNIVRQLQHIVGDELCTQCTAMFLEEQKCDAAGGLCTTASQRISNEAMYQKKAESHLTDENCFKVILYKNEAKLTIELLDTELNQSEGPTPSPRWTGYMDHVLLGEDTPNYFKDLSKSPVYLQRNARCRRNKTRNGPIDKTDVDSDSCKIDLSGLEDSAAGDAVKGLVGLNPGKAVCRSDYGKSSEEVPCLTTLCKFDINKYKILFVANNDSTNGDILLYKSAALGRARKSHPEVSEKLNRKFHCWHNKWLKDNVLEEESKKCQSWLLGHTEDSVPTKCIKVDDPLKPPYAVFNRYKIHEVT